ncbi:Hsp70 family protein [Allorhodopirellula solitaria]|uniref:Hsp70 family protein n=1 Tax=Allorhodopirellula solitaria TaxID=2527987 RepID=UPI00164648E2|nr:Hsp70 family protein [Allorhodopirellula solitaria]
MPSEKQNRSRGKAEPIAPAAPLGIDLGTTFSCVAQVNSRGVPRTLPNADGDLVTPSVVFFDTDACVVGKEAVKAAFVQPEMIARCVKREIGKPAFWKAFDGEQYPPEVIQSLILEKLKEDAQLKVGPVVDAVITVPAYFSEPKRRATQDAGRLAGLNVLDIINEPTAAAIAFGVEEGFLDAGGEAKSEETILVYDLGGGTFDVSVVRVETNRFRVLATDGDFQLGGVDWDQKIADQISADFFVEHLVDPSDTALGEQRLLSEAEDAKRSLSSREKVPIHFEHGGESLSVPLTRKAFEQMTASLLERTRFTTSKVVRDAGLKWADVTRILLVGGSTRMPAVTEMLENESGMRVDHSLAADEAVAHGAAIYANLIRRTEGSQPRLQLDNVEITNVNSHDLGVLGLEKATGMQRNKVLLRRNTALPAKHGAAFTTATDGQTSVAVRVVEGGDAGGNHSTAIGKCVIRGLPPGLPEGTQVNVVFQYENNGRLTVRATIPSLGKAAKMDIQRESSLSDSRLAEWSTRIRNRSNGSAAEMPAPEGAAPEGAGQSNSGKAESDEDGLSDIFDIDDFLQ